MHLFITLLATLTAVTSVAGNPAGVDKREPYIIYASEFAHKIPVPTSAPALEKRNSECQVVDHVVDALKFVSKLAYPFCSTYISVQIVTQTATATRTTSPDPKHATSVVTPAATTITTTTTTTTTPGTSTVYSTFTPGGGKEQKRAVHTLPSYLHAFEVSQVSQACSCLSFPPKTTTVTKTDTLSASVITSFVTASTPTSTSTSTSTVTVAAATTTIPTLCDPSALSITNGGLGSYGNDEPNLIPQPAATTILDCCIACFNAPNCLAYFLPSGECTLLTTSDPPGGIPSSPAQAALCPVGVSSQDTLFPQGIIGTGGNAPFKPGPCVVEALPFL